MNDSTATGTIIRIKGQDYFVSQAGGEVRCSLRGKFRLGSDPTRVLPVVGDLVDFRPGDSPDRRGPGGMITGIHQRRSIFTRADPGGRRRYRILGANLDFVLLVFAFRQPLLNTRLLDRMLVSCESGGMEPVICINKMDLAQRADELADELAVYERMKYDVILCSVREGQGIERLRALTCGRVSIMSGPSGAGKTSILGVMEPGLELRIGKVSTRTGKGRHTTTHFELHQLAGGGYLGDTPGIREFGICNVTKTDLADFFRDMEPWRDRCRFSTCTHSHEPSCEVKEAVERGDITADRYGSYLRILETLPDKLERI